MNIRSLKKQKLLTLFIPIFFETLLLMLSGIIDTLMISKLGDAAVGSVGTANTYIGMFFILFSVMSCGLIAVMTQFIGQNKKGVAFQARQLAIVINGTIGIILSFVLGFLAGPIVNALGVSDNLKNNTIIYLRIVGAGCLFDALIPVFSCYLRAFDKPKFSLIAALSGNVTNLLFNVFAIYVFHWGIAGVAVGTVVGKVVTLVLCFLFGKIFVNGLQYNERISRKQLVKDILRIGFPAAFETTVYSIASAAVTFLLGRMDANGFAIEVRTYAQQITNFPYCVVFALSQANIIIVGWNVGKHDFASCYKQTNKVAIIAIIFDVILEAIFALLSPWMLKIFTNNAELIRAIQYALLIDIALEVGRATNMVYGQTLKSTGDSIFPAAIAVIFNLLCSVGGTYLFGIVFNWQAIGAFVGLALDECVRAVFMYLRWRTGKWEKKVLVKEEEELKTEIL